MILMIDNQDSFTYNLIDYIKVQTTEEVKIISVNDLMTASRCIESESDCHFTWTWET